MPAHSSGAARGRVEPLGETRSTKRSVDDDLLRVAAVASWPGDVRVGRAVGADRAAVSQYCSSPSLQLAQSRQRVHHAADADGVADLELRDLGADGGDAADDLVARARRVDGAAPLVADGVEVGVADAAVEDVDLDILVDRGRGG